ncbi:TIGR04255 family protein [Phocaeicola barnesiae]|uniref:TIGR04255 family protein n=1 Tax=Phocaeicola barnesiae TaxID=376804 RepID=UPI0025A498B5|nr:TIGR04255 family protein [Phocaeicola barnesiae]MDM8254406.1 TIGR04255 family protein [Phocaeicola barnesiae]
MDRFLPSRIEKCPLIDALIEFRFEAAIAKSAVFGVIYNLIRNDYRGNVINLPILQIPEQIREVDPNLKFKPLYRVEGDKFIIQIGYDVLSISSKMPYVGWPEFSQHSLSLINKIIQEGIIKRVSRLGHRYINFFRGDITNSLTMSFSMTEKYVSENLLIRTDVRDGNFMNTLQFANNANYRPNPNTSEIVGSLIDIDTSREYSDNFFIENREQEINMAHECEKKLFFSLLKPTFLETLNPTFEK